MCISCDFKLILVFFFSIPPQDHWHPCYKKNWDLSLHQNIVSIHPRDSQTLHQVWPSVKKKNNNPEVIQSPQWQTLSRHFWELGEVSSEQHSTPSALNLHRGHIIEQNPCEEHLSTGQWNIHWSTLPFFLSLLSNIKSAGDVSLKIFRTFVAWFRLVRRSFRSRPVHLLYYPRYETVQGYIPAKFL